MRERAASLKEDISRAEERRVELRNAMASSNEERGELRHKLAHFERLERDYSNVLEDLEQPRLEQLQNELDEVTFRLRDAGSGEPAQIERQLRALRQRLEALRERRVGTGRQPGP